MAISVDKDIVNAIKKYAVYRPRKSPYIVLEIHNKFYCVWKDAIEIYGIKILNHCLDQTKKFPLDDYCFDTLDEAKIWYLIEKNKSDRTW